MRKRVSDYGYYRFPVFGAAYSSSSRAASGSGVLAD